MPFELQSEHAIYIPGANQIRNSNLFAISWMRRMRNKVASEILIEQISEMCWKQLSMCIDWSLAARVLYSNKSKPIWLIDW